MANSGKNTEVLMDGWKMSDVLNSIETPVTVDTAETTVFNSSGVKTYVTGNADATLTAEGFWPASSSDANTVESTLSAALATSSLNVWTWYPNGTNTGNAGYGATSIETGYSITSPVDGTVDISIDGQVSDGRDRILSLRPLSCGVTASATGTAGVAIDNSAATTNGGIGYFQRVTSSTKSLTVVIQDSNNNTTFDNLISFTAATARTGERIAVAGEVKQYVREVHTTTGVLGTAIDFNAGFRRK